MEVGKQHLPINMTNACDAISRYNHTMEVAQKDHTVMLYCTDPMCRMACNVNNTSHWRNMVEGHGDAKAVCDTIKSAISHAQASRFSHITLFYKTGAMSYCTTDADDALLGRHMRRFLETTNSGIIKCCICLTEFEEGDEGFHGLACGDCMSMVCHDCNSKNVGTPTEHKCPVCMEDR